MSAPLRQAVAGKPVVDEALALEHGLTPEEYGVILDHLGRTPTFEELGVFSVMWSEHCSYKSSRAHLGKFPTSGHAVLQGPGENAGAVDIGGGMAAIFKIESHNHPSYIEPYQGAATGVGGILRDIFTMGARPVANLNSLHFGRPGHEKTAFLLAGVVEGIGGYGNSVGVATVGGEVHFDAGYDGNILVNAFNCGIVRQDKIFRASAAGIGNPVLYFGSKTGRDGIHGASLLASSELKEESEQMKPTVQVGDPFTENLLIEACLEIMAGEDVVAIQDMGAAGLTSSSVEMASRGDVGVKLDLDRIPLREPDLTPYEMLLSESQERMILVARKGGEGNIAEICRRWGLDCVTIGEVTDDGRFTATHRGEQVASIPVAALTEAAPRYDRPQRAPAPGEGPPPLQPASVPDVTEAGAELLSLLGSPNLSSRRWVYEQYDQYVGANTVVGPGGDAAVVRVRETGGALAMTTDCNARWVSLDPYVGAQHAVAEAARNVAATGGRPLAVSDCLNFGSPEKPEVMWQFARAVEGMSEACRAFDAPVISGNVSFYNDNQGDSIPPTPVVAMVGLVADAERTAGIALADREAPASADASLDVWLLGAGEPVLDGSEYLFVRHALTGDRPPPIDLAAETALVSLVVGLIEEGLAAAAHDVSDGGVAVALAEMCMAGAGMGCDVELDDAGRIDTTLFGESGARILLATRRPDADRVRTAARAAGVPARRLGSSGGERLVIRRTGEDSPLVNTAVQDLRASSEESLPAIAAGVRQ
ncbi:MAG: phosphoribosylformylglycinamidine synthase subunit PurL [Candidatus Binatia bacterium]